MRKLYSILCLCLLAGVQVQAQSAPVQGAIDLKTEHWPARWISVPETGAQDYGVYYFRKDLDFASVPARYVVHVTGDNR